MSNPASDTLQKVSEEFEGEVLAQLEEAKSEALAAVEAARKETAQAALKTVETSAKQAESLKRQIAGAAELEARNAQLKSLEKAVNEVFDSAVESLENVSGSRREKSIGQLVKEGLEVIGPRARISSNAKDRKEVAAAIRKLNTGQVKLVLEDKSIDTIGGVILTAADGRVKFDNTFEARLERTRSALRKEAAGVLTSA